jgi:hypothetical protein
MIFIGSAILFAFGIALLLWQAIVISYHLIKLAVLLVAWCGCALALAVTACAWLGVKLMQGFRPGAEEHGPVVVINIDDVHDDTHTIEGSFRRVRG